MWLSILLFIIALFFIICVGFIIILLIKTGMLSGILDQTRKFLQAILSFKRRVGINDIIPQYDSNKNERSEAITAKSQRYEWSTYEGLPIGFVKGLPQDELPLSDYVAKRGIKELQIVANLVDVQAYQKFSNAFDKFEDYKKLYPLLPRPADDINILADDIAFALWRVAGPNPRVIQRLKGPLPSGCAFNDEILRSYGCTIASATEQGLLFICDYHLVDGATVATGRFFTAPFVLFIARERKGIPHELTPVAIQIDRKDPSSVVTPVDAHWNIAKLMVQVADLNHHELKSHLWDCHLAMEPFAVATARQLARNHPVGRLLRIHFRYMLLQNFAARKFLIAPDGPVDILLGTGRPGVLQILNNVRNQWLFGTAGLQADLNQRGFMNGSAPAIEYPYMEDALDVNSVIGRHVHRWIDIYYRDDNEVKTDWELQAWRNELLDPAMGRLDALPVIESKNDLEFILTQIIYTCTALHSAVNYSQHKYFSYIPNCPAAAWSDWHENPSLMNILPSGFKSNAQILTAATLALYQHDRLGQYPRLAQINARKAHQKLIDELKELKSRVKRRNIERSNRNLPQYTNLINYPFLHPDRIANSISI